MFKTISSNSESPIGVKSEDISKGQLQGRILNVSPYQGLYSVGLNVGFEIQLENYYGKTFKLVHTLTPISSDSSPITKEDILKRSELVFNPEYLILCSKETHEAIHKGGMTASDMRLIHTVERRPNDTTPWRK